MRRKIWNLVLVAVVFVFVGQSTILPGVYAEEESASQPESSGGMSISLMPVSKILQISSNSTYEDIMTVNNDGDSPMKIEVYAAPYSYVYSESEDSYKLGFNSDTNYTQMARWITFKNTGGDWVTKSTYDIAPKNSVEVNYRITTPESIPGGGQYAVIFAHTLSSSTNTSGIRTEASPGMVVYGRSSEGETIVKPIISDLKIEFTESKEASGKSVFRASAKVKNEGNVDFNAIGTMKIDNLFGGTIYETPQTSGRLSVIPEAELTVSDEWTEPPFFGVYKASWTVKVGDEIETIEKIVFVNFAWFLVLSIILLTIIVVGCIIRVRKRKERRSRLAV